MEGTHTVLQLHRPIMELCYVSFYLPRGKVRGFTYKGCVTLDKSSKRFRNCYQVRESSATEGPSRQTCENIQDIFFKQTTTKDILAELYKLNTEKEKLLATLLSSSHILGVKMGNQDGKLQDLSESMEGNDDENLGFKDQQESLVESTEKKSALKTKKPRKSSKRRESIEDFINKKIKRKISAVSEPSVSNRREKSLGSSKLLSAKCPADGSTSSFTYLCQENVEDKDNLLSSASKVPDKSRQERHLLESSGALGSDTDLSVSFSEYDNDVFGHCFAHSSHSLLDDVEDTLKGMKVPSERLLGNSFQETSATRPEAFHETEVSGTVHDYTRNSAHLPPEALGASAEIGLVLWDNRKGSKESSGSGFPSVMQEKKQEDYAQQPEEQEPVIEESCGLVGAVNKTLLKVIQSDRLDETAEWKRLQPISAPPGLLYEGREKRNAGSQPNNKHLSLHLPINLNPDICQTRINVKQEDKRPLSPSLVAVSNVFNNSYPPSNTYKQMSPLPSPLSSGLPSPQLHHRILPLPVLDAEQESAFIDSPSSRHLRTNFLPAKDLEGQLHLRFSEHPRLSMKQPGLYQGANVGHFGKISPQETSTLQPLQQLHSEYQAAILQLKREHKDEVEKLKSEFELKVFHLRESMLHQSQSLRKILQTLKMNWKINYAEVKKPRMFAYPLKMIILQNHSEMCAYKLTEKHS
ncbi:hypothetical protein JRQ81_000833 [Phrynocephalus forsythii]|uniref:Formin 1 n=1 Tax=Phrynocephalus forsythii TaxID=171643 RepID=A0A9Q1B7D9_9SAUR|nr:hypothetical protein JRQ81_000833 [Phrynocephalus forsythii]